MAVPELPRDVVHVAVGEDGYTSRSLVKWSIKNFPGKKLRITHVFSSRKMGGRFMRRNLTVEKLQNRRESVHSFLDQWIAICTEAGVEADKLFFEDESEEEGLLKLTRSDNIKWLVIGAAGSQKYQPGMRSIESRKALYIFECAPRNCKIWFVCNGKLIHIRKAIVETDDRSSASTSDQPVEEDDTNEEIFNSCQKEMNSALNLTEIREEAADHENELQELKIRVDKAEMKAFAAILHAKELEALYLKEVQERKEMEEAQAKKREIDKKIINERELRLEQRISEYSTELEELRNHPSVLTFRESEIYCVTCNFDESRIIGEGGFGIVYKGELHKTEVAVKVRRESGAQGSGEYDREVKVLQMMRHKNIITLIGVCPATKALIYEYLPNGSLEDWLKPKNQNSPLSWQTRIRIATELCSALVFLHSNRNHCFVHGDVKPSNILFDANMVTKLSDFGTSRLLQHSADSGHSITLTMTEPVGSIPYIDPVFLQQGVLTQKSDVYSFGLVLLRLLTGIEAMKVMKEVNDAWKSKELARVLDESAGEWPVDYAKNMMELARWCTQAEQENRPAMVDVWDALL